MINKCFWAIHKRLSVWFPTNSRFAKFHLQSIYFRSVAARASFRRESVVKVICIDLSTR
jgi:hypothetical protein